MSMSSSPAGASSLGCKLLKSATCYAWSPWTVVPLKRLEKIGRLLFNRCKPL